MTGADRKEVTIIPNKSKKLYDAWHAAGNIKGLTLAEIAARVGPADAGPPGAGKNGLGYSHTWSRPGYTVSVWFDDDRALEILPGSEKLG